MTRNVILHRLSSSGDALPAFGLDLRVARSTDEGQQSVSVSGTSAKTTNAIGSDTAVVFSTVDCFALAEADPTSTVAAGTPVPANQLIRLIDMLATDKLAFITGGATGTVYIRPGA